MDIYNNLSVMDTDTKLSTIEMRKTLDRLKTLKVGFEHEWMVKSSHNADTICEKLCKLTGWTSGKGMSKKEKKAALRSAISAKRREDRLLVVDELKLEEIKTRAMREWLAGLDAGDNALIVVAETDKKAALSARNLKKVKVLAAEGINVRDILLHHLLILTKDAAIKVQEALS